MSLHVRILWNKPVPINPTDSILNPLINLRIQKLAQICSPMVSRPTLSFSRTLWSLFESGESKDVGPRRQGGGLLHLRWPFGLREVVETAVLLPVGGGTPSSSRVRVMFPATAAAASRNKVLSSSPSPRRCSTPVPAASSWRRVSPRGVPVHESVGGGSLSSRGDGGAGFLL